jgi:hypothetical protein
LSRLSQALNFELLGEANISKGSAAAFPFVIERRERLTAP